MPRRTGGCRPGLADQDDSAVLDMLGEHPSVFWENLQDLEHVAFVQVAKSLQGEEAVELLLPNGFIIQAGGVAELGPEEVAIGRAGEGLGQEVVALHACALVEVAVAALSTLLLNEPVGSLRITTCGVRHLSDWSVSKGLVLSA